MLNLLGKDYKQLIGTKKRILFIILVLIMFIISTNYNTEKSQTTLPISKISFALVDSDQSPYSKLLIQYFKESESFSSYIQITEGSEAQLLPQFHKDQFDVYLKIPENFANNLIVLEHQPVEVLINAKDPVKAIIIRNLLESYETYISAVEINCVGLYDVMTLSGMEQSLIDEKNYQISMDLIFTALGKDAFFQYKEVIDYPSTSIMDYYFYALLIMIVSYAALYVGYQMMKEKAEGTFSRLHTIGFSVSKMIMEKVIFSVIVLLIVSEVVYAVSTFIGGTKINGKIMLVLFFMVLFYVSFAVFLSSVYYKIQNYMIVGNMIQFLLSILGGGIIPIMYLPEGMMKLAKFTPNYWITKVCLLEHRGIVQDTYGKLLIGLTICSTLFIFSSMAFYSREEVRLDD